MSTDLLGREFKVGDRVAKGVSMSTSTACVEIYVVTRFNAKGMPILGDSRNALLHPERLLIVNEVPGVSNYR